MLEKLLGLYVVVVAVLVTTLAISIGLAALTVGAVLCRHQRAADSGYVR